MAGTPTPATVTFRMQAPLAHDYFLNVSKSVSGTIFLSTTAAETLDHDYTVYRIELFVDDKRVFGMQNITDLGTTYTGVLPIGVNQRSEIHFLPKGAILSVKVTRVSGLSELGIGTGGATQSHIAVAFFRQNPLSGAVYVERGTLLVGATGTDPGQLAVEADKVGGPGPYFVEAPEQASGVAVVAFAGLGLVAAVAVVPPRGRRHVLILVLMACTLGPVFAGCMGSPDSDGGPGGAPGESPELTRSTVDVEIVDRDGLNASAGDIQGRVQDRLGLPIPEAHVSLLGTLHSRTAGADGEFSFRNLSAGPYVIRVDAQKYLAVERAIEVVAGRLTQLNVTLLRDVKGTDIHSHDYWGGETKRTVMDKTVNLQSYLGYQAGDRSLCPGSIRCETRVQLDEGQAILPGTTLVEIVLTGTAPVAGPQEFEARVVTAGNQSGGQRLGPRRLGEPFQLAIFPNEADPGHQRVSRWEFFVAPFSQAQIVDVLAPPVAVASSVHIVVTIHKGVVPYEPVHQDFWQGKTEMVVVAGRTISSTHTSSDYPMDEYTWSPDKGAFVPPGTKELRGTLTWTHPQNAPTGTTWGLVYRAADMPPGAPWRKFPSVTPGTNRLDFTYAVKAAEADQFYQTISYWKFAPDDQQAPLPLSGWNVNTGYGTKFTFTATAYRDPAWVETAT